MDFENGAHAAAAKTRDEAITTIDDARLPFDTHAEPLPFRPKRFNVPQNAHTGCRVSDAG
ncbi:hypothetical protein FP2506_01030 [Fulvimarina pelagi HTCC2506]|uniref:Uncharacterized protein n=1 Tax=Fulvimarina pelagi HTCC2506 TaxID=314231 RepID=Q0G291_9HYPH|nr:hypothetical protein FP2506_01030 [Fulvimarina pelagi HTCC2506]